MAYNIGAKIGIDGEAEFRRQIKSIDAEYKALTAQIEAQTAALGKGATAEEKAEANAQALRRQKELLEQREKLLTEALDKSTQANGKDAEATNRLRAAMYDTERRATELGDKIQGAGDDMEQAGEKALDFGDVLKANVLSDAIMAGLQKLAGYVKEFAGGMIEAAASVQATEAQFTQTFGSAADAAKGTLETIAEQTGITATRMEASYTKIFAFAKTSGADTEEAMDIASRAMTAAADSAAYYDRSIEDVTETVQAFLKGNYANDAALGIAATETTRNTAANKLYAKSFQELSESQKVDVLLSMVEAGNEASGALGQAAREADAWENVNGELAESVRQLQAEAGKPFLKQLTPIIQKLTQKIRDLTKNADWEAFGSAVADTFEVIVDHGPEVLRVLTSIGAGVAAFKAVEKTEQLVSMASGFLRLGEAATSAGAMVEAGGAVAAASPWGLAAVAIGAVAGAVTAAVLEIKASETELDHAIDSLQSSMERADENFRATQTDTEGAAIAAETYIRRLRELEAGGLKTAAAQKEYELTVEALNNLIPDLNLAIDEQTGLISQNTEELLGNVEAWKKQALAKALQEKYSAEIEAQAKAQAELITAQVKQNDLDRQQADLATKRVRLTKALSAAQARATMAQSEYEAAATSGIGDMQALGEAYSSAKVEADNLQAELTATENSLLEVTNASNKNKDSMAEAEETIKSYDATIQEAEAAMSAATATQEESNDIMLASGKTVSQVREEMAALREQYDAAKTSAYESSLAQVGYFDEISTESDWSTDKILQNFEDQAAAFTGYSDNLQKAIDMGLDEALVEQLSDGSQESMQILAALVTGTEEDIAKVNEAFKQSDEARQTMAGTMAEIQTGASKKMDEMAKDMRSGAKHIVQGAADGISEYSYLFEDAVADMAASGQRAFRAANLIHSPSRLYERDAGYIPEGAARGVELKTKDFEKSIARMSELGEKQLDAAAMERAMWAQPTGAVTNSSTTNVGGVSIYVTAQDGDTAEQVADLVMDKIQTEVWRRER